MVLIPVGPNDVPSCVFLPAMIGTFWIVSFGMVGSGVGLFAVANVLDRWLGGWSWGGADNIYWYGALVGLVIEWGQSKSLNNEQSCKSPSFVISSRARRMRGIVLWLWYKSPWDFVWKWDYWRQLLLLVPSFISPSTLENWSFVGEVSGERGTAHHHHS